MKSLFFSLLMCLWATVANAQTSVMDFYNAKEKTFVMFGGNAEELYIRKKDVANGFISYSLPNMGVPSAWEEMAYYTSKNGKKFVATVIFQCVQMCETTVPIPQFSEIKEGTLVNKTEKYLPTSVVKQIADALGEKEGKLIFQLGTAVKLTKWVKLPQVGTTIQIGLQEFGDEQFKFHLACELTYNETNGTFTFVKK